MNIKDVAILKTKASQSDIINDATPFAGADIAAVKAKTDLIPAAPAAQAKIDTSLYTSRLATAAGAVVNNTTVSIQPPAGETWEIIIAAGGTIASAARSLHIEYWNGAAVEVVDAVFTGADGYIAVAARMRITNARYARITWTVAGWGSGDIRYSYHGWKE